MKCPYCNQEHPNNAKFCPATGQSLLDSGAIKSDSGSSISCPNCSKTIPKHTKFCPFCGYPIIPMVSITNRDQLLEKKHKQSNFIFLAIAVGIVFVITGFLILNENDAGRSNDPLTEENSSEEIRETMDVSQLIKSLAPDLNDVSESVTINEIEMPVNMTSTSQILSLSDELSSNSEDELVTPTISDLTQSISTPTITPTKSQTEAPDFGEEWIACPGLFPSRIQVGYKAKVSEDPPLSNRVRSNAGISYSILGYIDPGERVTVLEGPACANDWIWWKIRSDETGLKGWTVEGDGDDYWLIPVK